MQKIFKKLEERAKNIIKYSVCDEEKFFRCVHFSFILRRNKILVESFNIKKTDSSAIDMGYPFGYLHSEAGCIKRLLKNSSIDPKDCKLVNLRLARASGGLLLAAPCPKCLRLIFRTGIRTTYFSINSSSYGKVLL